MNKIDFNIFRKNIIRVRAVRGLSSRELCEKANLRHVKRIADIEDGRGHPTLEEVHAICEVVGYPMDLMLFVEAKITLNFQTIR